jgi:hypothetical protein
MKDSTWIVMSLAILCTLAFGIFLGFALALDEVHKQAVANGAGRWVATSSQSVVFVWEQPTK